MGNNFSLTRARIDFKSILFILATHPTFVAAWNDHYDKEDDAWVMKIFFPIIAALILLCLGSCGYANYCKKPTEHNEDEEVDRSEEVYSLSKPDRPYLTPHYQFNPRHPPTTIMHFDLARHQVVALVVRLVAQNRSQPVQFIKDTIQLVKWALVDNKGSVVRAKGNSDKLIKPLQIHILNFNLNLIKIKQSNQIHSDHTVFKFHNRTIFTEKDQNHCGMNQTSSNNPNRPTNTNPTMDVLRLFSQLVRLQLE